MKVAGWLVGRGLVRCRVLLPLSVCVRSVAKQCAPFRPCPSVLSSSWEWINLDDSFLPCTCSGINHCEWGTADETTNMHSNCYLLDSNQTLFGCNYICRYYSIPLFVNHSVFFLVQFYASGRSRQRVKLLRPNVMSYLAFDAGYTHCSNRVARAVTAVALYWVRSSYTACHTHTKTHYQSDINVVGCGRI